MKNSFKFLLLSFVFLIFWSNTIAQKSKAIIPIHKEVVYKELNRLWIDNAIYTRLSILCLTDRLQGVEETLARLMKNQEDIGEFFSKYYTREQGDEFCQLISSNTALIVRIIRSKNTNSTTDLDVTQKRIPSNFNDLLNFLVRLNPNLNKEILASKLGAIVELMNTQIDMRISGNYAEDIQNFDKIITQSIDFSDILAKGIIKQFPKRFI